MLDHGVHGRESQTFITRLCCASNLAVLPAWALRKSQPVSKVSLSANRPRRKDCSVILLSGAQHISQTLQLETPGLVAVLLWLPLLPLVVPLLQLLLLLLLLLLSLLSLLSLLPLPLL